MARSGGKKEEGEMSAIAAAAAAALGAASAVGGPQSQSPRHASPHRPRHQITRSITEISGSMRLHNHQQQHHHRRHHHHHRNQHSIHHRRAGRDEAPAPQSAGPLAQGRGSMDGGPRSEAGTPNLSPNPSRRASILGGHGLEDGGGVGSSSVAGLIASARHVAAAGERGQKGASDLKAAMLNLNEFSSATTRRLNLRYASILEKLSVLQGTVSAMKELSDMCEEVRDDFSRDSDELLADAGLQLEALGRLDGQRRRIESLQTRIHDGREKIQSLSDRVDVVRERIEGWERADREWQERTRRRLKTGWMITSGVVLVVVVLMLLSARFAPEGGLGEATKSVAPGVVPSLLPGAAPGNLSGGEARSGEEPSARLSRLLANHTGGSSTAAVEDKLRLFDEL